MERGEVEKGVAEGDEEEEEEGIHLPRKEAGT